MDERITPEKYEEFIAKLKEVGKTASKAGEEMRKILLNYKFKKKLHVSFTHEETVFRNVNGQPSKAKGKNTQSPFVKL